MDMMPDFPREENTASVPSDECDECLTEMAQGSSWLSFYYFLRKLSSHTNKENTSKNY